MMRGELRQRAQQIAKAVPHDVYGTTFYWSDGDRALSVGWNGRDPIIVYQPPVRGQDEIIADIDLLIAEVKKRR